MKTRNTLVAYTTLLILSANGAKLEWSPCPQTGTDNISCAFFDIPLDYHNASAGSGRILVAKANATASPSRGILFYNPGGPGVSGVTDLGENAQDLLRRTGGTHDIISWDPRGVGSYTYPGNVVCIPDDEYDAFWNGTIEVTHLDVKGDFTDPADLAHLYSQAPIMEQKYRELGERCLSGPNATTLGYLGTAANVRDMVALADALQGPDTPVNYWGLSYGSLLGVQFANMFPDRVGRVIVDGVLDATNIATKQSYLLWRDQQASAEAEYDVFAEACARSGPEGCLLAQHAGASAEDVKTFVQQKIDLAHDHPVGDVTAFLLRVALYSAMYRPETWSNVANVTLPEMFAKLANASLSQPSVMTSGMSPSLARRDETYSNSYSDGAILCSDSVDADPSVTMKDVFDEVVSVSQNVSMFGSFWPVPWLRCAFWPVRAVERYQGPFNKTLANPIAAIGITLDNATPFYEAQHVAEVMGDQARLIRQNGFGHTTLAQRSSCIDNIMQTFLMNGTLPAGSDTVCEIDASEELFPGVSSISVKPSL